MPHDPEGDPSSPRAAIGRELVSLTTAIRPAPGRIAAARRRLHRKAIAILSLTIGAYSVLVLVAVPLPVKILSATVLAVGLVLVGTGIMHDANHGAFSRSRRVNRIFGFTMDLVGGSALLWRFKHNVLHHGHTNVVGVDRDFYLVPLARLAPQQPWFPWHRYQHLYLWPLYGLMSVHWVLGADVVNLLGFRRNGQSPAMRASSLDAVLLVAGKAAHLTWTVLIPLAFHPWWAVLAFYLACSWCASLLLVTIFQVAHCVEDAEFVGLGDTYRGERFQHHQLRTTVNVSCPAPVLRPVVRFVMGGLDHQIEHHLMPNLPHTIYPLVAERLKAECSARGLPYRCHPSLASAVGAHVAWLKLMGTRPALS